MIDSAAGFSRTILIQLNINAGRAPKFLLIGPKQDSKYEYSAPDRVMKLPNSAYANAPRKDKIRINSRLM